MVYSYLRKYGKSAVPRFFMKSTLLVSARGQITLPSSSRKKMGIQNGGVVTLEEVDGKLIISPAAVMEVEMYSPQRIESFLREDRFEKGEREKLDRKLARRKK
jgi:antitoxin PrlF